MGEAHCVAHRASLHLEPDRLHDRTPTSSCSAMSAAKSCGDATVRLESELDHAAAQLGRLQALVDFGVEPRRPRRRASRAAPTTRSRSRWSNWAGRFRPWSALGKFGARVVLVTASALSFPVPDQRNQRRGGAEIHLNASAQHVGHRLRAALVGNAGDLGCGFRLEQSHRPGAASVPCPKPKLSLPGIGFRVADEFRAAVFAGKLGAVTITSERAAASVAIGTKSFIGS